MGILVISPTHYEGLMWVGLYFGLLTFLPILYSFYNGHTNYQPTIVSRNSPLQTAAFLGFMLSIFCIASILPCGRYYYEPEGGYLGNPWIKVSLQYSYLYLLWFIHHLDIIEFYIFKFAKKFNLIITKIRENKKQQLADYNSSNPERFTISW